MKRKLGNKCYTSLQKVFSQEQGNMVLEAVIIIAIIIAIALLFNTEIRKFAADLFAKVFNLSKLDSIWQ